MRRTERGQVTPLIAAVVLVAMVLALAAARFGQAANERARAQAAADAAALAAALDGPEAARRLTVRNHAELVEVEVDGSEAVVTVRVGDAAVTARAVVAATPDTRRGTPDGVP